MSAGLSRVGRSDPIPALPVRAPVPTPRHPIREMFDPQFLDEIRERVALSEIVGRRVRLQRRGREHVGLCPFHNEKTPSFTVNDDKGVFYCFGCQAQGSHFKFVMRAESLSSSRRWSVWPPKQACGCRRPRRRIGHAGSSERA